MAIESSSVEILIIATWKRLLRQKTNFEKRPLSQQGNVCRDTERRSLCCDKVMYVTTFKEEELLVVTDKQSHEICCLLSKLTRLQQKNPS